MHRGLVLAVCVVWIGAAGAEVTAAFFVDAAGDAASAPFAGDAAAPAELAPAELDAVREAGRLRVRAEMDAMHTFWCAGDRTNSPLCVRHREMGGAPAADKAEAPAARKLMQDEVASMHAAFCVEEAVDTYPCKRFTVKRDRSRRRKLNSRNMRPEFMDL
ncbi:hypothetical protein M885DRAFT_615912 [Pelagophyceae sp. CCMP2097]|nr:hypothetical protein M885DRAFT_615912 [Pelagophyceae sp. CCMP2097]